MLKNTAMGKKTLRLGNLFGLLMLCGLVFGQMDFVIAQRSGSPSETATVPDKPKRGSIAFWEQDARLTTTRLTIAPDTKPTISSGSALFRQIRSDANVRVSTNPDAVRYRELPLVIGASDVSCAALLDGIGAFYMCDWQRTAEKSYILLPPLLIAKEVEDDKLRDAKAKTGRPVLESLRTLSPATLEALQSEAGVAYGQLSPTMRRTLTMFFDAGQEAFKARHQRYVTNFSLIYPPLQWDSDVRIRIGAPDAEHGNRAVSYTRADGKGDGSRELSFSFSKAEIEEREAQQRLRQEQIRRATNPSFQLTTKFELRNEGAKQTRAELKQRVTLPLMKQTTPAGVMIALHKLYPKIAFVCKPASVSILSPINGAPMRADIAFDDVPLGEALDEMARVFQIGWELRPMGVLVLRNPNQQSRYVPLGDLAQPRDLPPP